MAAPSFSSFPPSFSSFPDLDSSSNKESSKTASSSKGKPERDRKQSSSKHRHDAKAEKKDKKRDKDRRRSPRRREHSPSRDEGSSSKRHEQQDTLGSSSRLFYSDTRGDIKNIQYGGLHAGDIPKYYVVNNSRNVLGLSKSFTIFRRAGKGVEVGLSRQRKMSSLTDSGSRALLRKPPTKRLLPLPDCRKYEEIEGFIPLPSRKGPQKPEESYRSITGGKDDSDSDSSHVTEDDASSSDGGDEHILTAHQETLKSLEQHLTANPDDTDKWLALLRQTLSTIPITSKNATQARSEITLSILSRALSADKQNSNNKMLRIFYLKAGEEVWHESKLRAEWEDAFKAGDIEIRMEWLDWRIRSGQGGLDSIAEAAVRALGSLGMEEAAEVAKVRIFWRVAAAMRSAGYGERAMALFQAQAELAFHAPPNVSKMAFQTQLNELEEFWDSEAPRIGEDGAKGWNSWYSSKDDQMPPATPPVPSAVPDLDPYRQWARQESFLDSKLILPSRSDSDTSDPYSMILFADIRPFLIDIRAKRALEGFRLVWLSFLGLHVPGFTLASSRDLDWDDRWNMDFVTRASYLDSIFPSDGARNKLLTDAVAGVVIGRERDYASPFGPVRCWGHGVCDPLDPSSAEPGRPQRRGVWSPDDIANVDENLVRRTFTGLAIGKEDVEWTSLSLAFELAVNSKNATKVSKALLSSNPDSLLLWGIHAQLERLRGRLDDARKVYQTALIASKPNNAQQNLGRLWWNWAEMEWLAGGEKQSLNVILKSIGLEESSSGVTLLRAKRSLDALIVASGSENWKDQEAWMKLQALLELLTTEQPSAALAVFDEYLALESQGTFKESLTTASLLMLYYYGVILRKPMPPAILRERAYATFEAYPNNSIILGTLLEAEKGQAVWGRLRTMMSGSDGMVKDVARRVEEVWVAGWEKGRWLSEVERTRNGLAAAVEHERTRCSPVIWRIYIEFEIRVGDLQRAKKLLFRAIGECPMVKETYLLAFGPLRSVFASHELNGLADTMVERGIRLHQGLDEVLDGLDVVEEHRSAGEEESDDEIEHNARELRRLKPY